MHIQHSFSFPGNIELRICPALNFTPRIPEHCTLLLNLCFTLPWKVPDEQTLFSVIWMMKADESPNSYCDLWATILSREATGRQPLNRNANHHIETHACMVYQWAVDLISTQMMHIGSRRRGTY